VGDPDVASVEPVAPGLLVGDVQGRLDAALAGLDELKERPVSEHVALLEAAHTVLRETLEGPAPQPTTSSG